MDESRDGDADVLGKNKSEFEHEDTDKVGDPDAAGVAGGEAMTSMGSVPPNPIKTVMVL